MYHWDITICILHLISSNIYITQWLNNESTLTCLFIKLVIYSIYKFWRGSCQSLLRVGNSICLEDLTSLMAVCCKNMLHLRVRRRSGRKDRWWSDVLENGTVRVKLLFTAFFVLLWCSRERHIQGGAVVHRVASSVVMFSRLAQPVSFPLNLKTVYTHCHHQLKIIPSRPAAWSLYSNNRPFIVTQG